MMRDTLQSVGGVDRPMPDRASRPRPTPTRSGRHAAAQPAQPTNILRAGTHPHARPAGPPPQPAAEPVQVERRVSTRGAITIARQRIHIGIVHAGRTLTVESADHTFRIYDGDQLLAETGRTTT